MKKKSLLQRCSTYAGIICELIALGCLVMLFIKKEELGMDHVISASFLASTFFFFTCGIVFIVMGRTNIPSFDFDDQNFDDQNKENQPPTQS